MSFLSALTALGGDHLWTLAAGDPSGTCADSIGTLNGTYGSVGKLGPVFGDGLSARIGNANGALVTIPDDNSLDFGNTFTVGVWLRRTDRDQMCAISKGWYVYINGDDSSDSVIVNNGSANAISSGGYVTTADWYFLVVTVDAGNVKAYLGQGKDWTATATTTDVTGTATNQTFTSNTSTLRLGVFPWGAGGWRGAMRNLFTAPTALTKTQVDSLFQAQSPYPAPDAGLKIGLHLDLCYEGTATGRTTRLDRADGVGAQIARHTLPWDVVQGTDSATFDWTRPDDIVTKSAARGVEPLFVFARSPQWANGSTDRQVVPGADQNDAAFTAWRTAYTTWATAAVARYKPGGTFGSSVTKWELWNEPNFGASWNRAASGVMDAAGEAQYTAWANAMRTAITTEHAAAEVAVGALGAPNAVGAGSIRGEQFLRDCVTAGLSTSFGIVSLHPYPSSTRDAFGHADFQNNFDDLQRLIDALHDIGGTWATCAVWVTEWGWQATAAGNTVSNDVGLTNQAAYIEQSLLQIRDRYSGSGVPVATYFQDVDSPSQSFYHGLYESDGTAKPSASTFSTFMGVAGASGSGGGMMMRGVGG